MDVTSTSSAMSAQQTRNEVQIAVLKKTMDMSAQAALQLIEAIPPAPASNPPHLGSRVDTHA